VTVVPVLPVECPDGPGNEDMETRLRDLSFLYELTSSLGCTLDLEADLDAFVERLARLLVVEVAALFVQPSPEESTVGARVRAAIGIPPGCRFDLELPRSIGVALASASDPGLCHWSPTVDTPLRAELEALRTRLNPRLASLHGIGLRLSGRFVGALLFALDLDQVYETIVPSASLADPARFTELVGRKSILSIPASTTGGWLVPGASTVILTSEKLVAPRLSSTVTLKM
jgi:hypothetical protein